MTALVEQMRRATARRLAQIRAELTTARKHLAAAEAEAADWREVIATMDRELLALESQPAVRIERDDVRLVRGHVANG